MADNLIIDGGTGDVLLLDEEGGALLLDLGGDGPVISISAVGSLRGLPAATVSARPAVAARGRDHATPTAVAREEA